MIWFLTPAGRIQARNEYRRGSYLYSDDAILKYYEVPQINIDNTKLQNNIKDYISKFSRERIEAIKQGNLLQQAQNTNEYADFSEVNAENIEFDQADIELPNHEIYNSTLEDIENLIFEKAFILIPTFIETQKSLFCNKCGNIDEYPVFILDEFRKWILKGITSPSIVNIYKDNPWSFWNDNARLVLEKQYFAKFCLRYLSICSSSAC